MGDERNGRREGNSGLVFCNGNGDGNGDGNGNCARQRGVGEGGGGERGVGFFSINCFYF